MAKSDRCGKRKKRSEFSKRSFNLGYYVIVTDTDATEKKYLEGLRNSLPESMQNHIAFKFYKSKTEDLIQTCEEANMDAQYRQPWIVFDRDRVPNFDEIIKNAEIKGIRVGWSNPCIEIWFDCYFGKMHPYLESTQCCSRFSETFLKEVGKEYRKADNHIYELLTKYGDEKNAISIAEKNLNDYQKSFVEKPSKMCPATTLHYLIREIKSKSES